MSDAHQALSYSISADDRASAVFRGVSQELRTMQGLAQHPLQGLNREWETMAKRQPLQMVKAEQAVQIARTEQETAKLTRTIQAAGVATKLQAAELDLLAQRHAKAQKAIDGTAASHARLTKAGTVAAAGVVGTTALVVAGAVKQNLAWNDLAKNIEQQTGLSGKSLDNLMGTINNVTGKVPYKLDEISQAAVILKQRFHESDPQIEKSAGLMAGFAKRAGSEVTPAIQGLSNILHSYRAPLSDVVGLTDELVSVSQLTQQPLGTMESTIERFSPKLQAMGFGLKDSIRLMGILGESGVRADQMGRGLATAYGAAQKALGGAAGPQAALLKLTDATTKAREKQQVLEATAPKTLAEQVRHTAEVKRATEATNEAVKKEEAFKKVLAEAGGAHASVANMVKAEIVQIEHAKSSNEAFSLGVAAFGKQVGPSFARAFYNNKAAVEATDHALHKHGATQKLVEAEQKEFQGEVTELNEAWHKTERTLGKDLIPALKTFLGLVKGGVDDVSKFTKGNASLAEALGGIATLGAGAFLLRKPIGAALSGASHLPGLGGLAKIPGIGGSSGLYGIRGAAMPGSPTNPVVVTVEGGRGVGPGTGVSTGEKAAGEGLLAKAGKGLKAAGGATLAIEALNIVLPGNAAARGVPTHGSGVGGDFKGWIHDSSEAFTTGFGDLLNGNIGKALSDVFGHNRVDDLRSFGDELKKLKGPLSDLPSAQMRKIHDEAVSLGRDNSLSKWRPQLEAIAKATDPVQIALAKAGGSFSRLRFTAEKELGLLSAHMAPTVKPGTTAAAKAFMILRGAIEAEMSAGVRSTESGTKKIQQILTQQLHSLGLSNTTAAQKQSGAFGPGPGSGSNPLQPTGTGESSGFNGAEGATGIRVPGRVGPDNWTLIDPSGRPAAKVGGAELLIANRHTENAASVATKLVYGKTLGQMVAGERTPHSAATGLRIRGPVSTFGPPGEAAGGTAYGKSSADAGIAVNPHGGGAWNDALAQSLGMKVAHVTVAGHSANLRVIDKGPSAIGSKGPRLIDVTGAGASAMGISPGAFPTDSIGEAVFGDGVGPAATVGRAAASAHIKRVIAKGVGGVMRRIVQGTLDKEVRGANAFLSKLAPKAPAGGGTVTAAGAAPTGGGYDPSQVGIFDGLQVAKWIIPELAYARGHGWPGHITSGVRLGFDPHAPSGSMHALDVYPGGAVDFGGMVDPVGLANRAAFIAATAGYHGKRLLTPIGFRDDGHMSGTGHELGGRVDYAGAFGQGGSVTASKPTLALFGEKGTETATFTPHASLGQRVGSSGLAETPGNNPETGQIEYHTQEDWAELRRQYTAHHRPHHAPKGTRDERLNVQGVGYAGTVTLSAKDAHGTIDVPGDLGKLSTTVWKKVLAALEGTIKASPSAAIATGWANQFSREHARDPKAQARLKELAGASIKDAAKTVVALTKATPQEEALGASTGAITSLGKLVKDARRTHNAALVSLLRKDTEWAYKWASSTIQRTASETPAGQAAGAAGTAVSQLSKLMVKAGAEGRRTIQLALLKDMQKEIASWHTAIASTLGKRQEVAKAGAELRVSAQTLSELRSGGAGTKVKAGTAHDATFVKAEEAANVKAVAEMQKEQKAISAMIGRERTLLGKLNAKMHREIKHHHKAAARVIQLEINQIQAALGEAQSQMEEVTASIQQAEAANLNLAAESMKAAYETFKEEIDETTRAFEAGNEAIGTRGSLEEGQLHREGKDFGGLAEAKGTQEGALTPAQIQQAQSDLAAFTQRKQEEINSDVQQRAYDESKIGGLSGEDRTNMQKSIEALTRGINELENSIYDQTKETKKLTEATNAAAKTFGGTVGFEYQGQQYTPGGQSSVSAPDIMTGV